MQWTAEHLGLAADDPVALAGWYRGVPDGQEVCRCENPGKAPTLFTRVPGGLILEIYPATDCRSETALNCLRGWRHLALRVPTLEAARVQLAGRGVAFMEGIKPAGGGGRVLFFQDPEGNLLHLVERPSDPFI